MSTPMRRTSPNQFVEVRAERLEGAPVAERRRWSDAFKEQAVAASLAPGVNISALARSLEITPSQLFGWRGSAAKRASQDMAKSQAASPQRIEIEIGGAVVRVAADLAMIPSGARVFLRAGAVDFRKGPDGLVALVRDGGADPFNGALYVFRSKRADRIKIVWFDGSGLCLFAKRLEQSLLIPAEAAHQNEMMSPAVTG
jgi:transposase-like protein